MKRATVAKMARLVQLAFIDVSQERRESVGVAQCCWLNQNGTINYAMYSASFAFVAKYNAAISKKWPENFVSLDKLPNLQDLIERQDQIKRTNQGLFILDAQSDMMPFQTPKKSKEEVAKGLEAYLSGYICFIPAELFTNVTKIVTHDKSVYLCDEKGHGNWVHSEQPLRSSFFGLTDGIHELLKTGCMGGITFLPTGMPLFVLKWSDDLVGCVCPTTVQAEGSTFEFCTALKKFTVQGIEKTGFENLKEERITMGDSNIGLDALKSLTQLSAPTAEDVSEVKPAVEEKQVVKAEPEESVEFVEKPAPKTLEEKVEELKQTIVPEVKEQPAVPEPEPEQQEQQLKPDSGDVPADEIMMELIKSFVDNSKRLNSIAKIVMKDIKSTKAAQKKLDALAAAKERIKELEAKNAELERKFETMKKLFE